LGEEKSKHASLAQQDGCGLAFFAQFAASQQSTCQRRRV